MNRRQDPWEEEPRPGDPEPDAEHTRLFREPSSIHAQLNSWARVPAPELARKIVRWFADHVQTTDRQLARSR